MQFPLWIRKYHLLILSAFDAILVCLLLDLLYIRYQLYTAWQADQEFLERWGTSAPDMSVFYPDVRKLVPIFICIFIASSSGVRRVFPYLRKRIVIFWIVSGLVAITGLNLSLLLASLVEGLFSGHPVPFDRFYSLEYFFTGPMSLALVTFFNTVYGITIKAALKFFPPIMKS